MESSPLKLKQQKKSDTLLYFDKCLICQKKFPDNHKLILNPTRQGKERLIEAVKSRKDDLFNQLDEHFVWKPENLVESSVIWHKNCYSSYTNKTNLSHVESHGVIADETEGRETCHMPSQSSFSGQKTSLHSKTPAVDWNLCIFCQQKKYHGQKDLCQIRSLQGEQNLKIAIAKQDDDKMMHLVNGAADAKYHPLCRSTYISKGRTQVYEPRPEEEDAYKSAFQILMKIYDKGIRARKVFETSTLLVSYKSLLEGKVQNASNYPDEKVKRRLSKFYGDAIIFPPQSGKNKPEFVYCASVSLKDAINALSEMKQRKSESIFIAQKKSSFEVHERPQEGVLLNAAQILASALREVKGIQTCQVTAADISAAKAEVMVSDVLYMFLRWIFDEAARKDANPIRMHSDKERLHCRFLSVSQDMILLTQMVLKIPLSMLEWQFPFCI